jgi:hypothetical protein
MAEHPSYTGAALAGAKLYNCLLKALRDAEDSLAVAEVRRCLDEYEEEMGIEET